MQEELVSLTLRDRIEELGPWFRQSPAWRLQDLTLIFWETIPISSGAVLPTHCRKICQAAPYWILAATAASTGWR